MKSKVNIHLQWKPKLHLLLPLLLSLGIFLSVSTTTTRGEILMREVHFPTKLCDIVMKPKLKLVNGQ